MVLLSPSSILEDSLIHALKLGDVLTVLSSLSWALVWRYDRLIHRSSGLASQLIAASSFLGTFRRALNVQAVTTPFLEHHASLHVSELVPLRSRACGFGMAAYDCPTRPRGPGIASS